MNFKTNINCPNCLAKVSQALNQIVGEGKWSIDLSNPDKVLRVESNTIEETLIIDAIKEKGFIIEKI